MDTDFGNKEIIDKIIRIKHELGKDLVILTHHYQRREIVELGDHRGDTFGLVRRVARDENARYIMFCGVHFMAESAAILAREKQIVQTPDLNAGCWLSETAPVPAVEKAWEELLSVTGEEVTPIAYMNSSAGVKAHCGRHKGTVCASSNALAAFEWAFKQRKKIFFLPDAHLGRNAARAMNIPENEILEWDGGKPMGGHDGAAIKKARVILWKGHCLVHAKFTGEQIQQVRKNFPDGRIVVHPECPHEVVKQADACGSTGFIARYVNEAPHDATIVVGTEINLIKRLAAEHPDKKILPLYDTFCPNMHQINLKNLLHSLEQVGRANVVQVDPGIRRDARRALEYMLSI